MQVAIGTTVAASVIGFKPPQTRKGLSNDPIASGELLKQGWLHAKVVVTSTKDPAQCFTMTTKKGLDDLPPLGSMKGPKGIIFGAIGTFKVQWTLERVLPGADFPESVSVEESLRQEDGIAFVAEVQSPEYELSVIEPQLKNAHHAIIEKGPATLKHLEPFSLTLALSFDKPAGQAQPGTPVHISPDDAVKVRMGSSSQLDVRCALILD